jgi:catechol 2,3-dioxygenase-like lactoylglutathione lyase family enzyme
MNLNHIGVTVGDIGQAIDFYTAVFGLELLVDAEHVTRDSVGVERRIEIFGERWGGMLIAHLADDNGTGLELFQFTTPEVAYPPEHFDYWRIGVSHLSFSAPDIEETIARLEAHGGRARTAVHELLAGCRICYCMDPWGNPIELSTGSYRETHPPVAPTGAI